MVCKNIFMLPIPCSSGKAVEERGRREAITKLFAFQANTVCSDYTYYCFLMDLYNLIILIQVPVQVGKCLLILLSDNHHQ